MVLHTDKEATACGREHVVWYNVREEVLAMLKAAKNGVAFLARVHKKLPAAGDGALFVCYWHWEGFG